jgi:hypothetical protein
MLGNHRAPPVVPVVFADEHQREVLRRDPARLDQELHRVVVVALGRVIHRLHVVRVGSPLEQQARQGGVVGDAGRAIQRRLALGVFARGPESGIRVRAGVEQCRGRPEESVRPLWIEPEVLRDPRC